MVAVVLAVAFAVAAYRSLRLAYADFVARGDTVAALEGAIRIEEDDAEFHLRLAELDPSRRRAELEAAAGANPYLSSAKIQLGLIAESDGDFARAEQYLLEAAATDKTFVPRWSLAGYYFRRQDEDDFWIWVRAAAERSYGDTTAIYRLCWRVTDDADRILNEVIPKQPEPLARYLIFLLQEDRLEAANGIVRLLLPMGGKQYLGVLVGYCERLLIHRDEGGALEAWNALIAHNLLPYSPLAPEAGRSLTNGGFEAPPLGRGFDWRLIESEGVRGQARSGSLRISLNGRQADIAELLSQYVPLEPATSYRLVVTWSGAPPPPEAGFGWYAADSVTREALPLDGDPPVLRTGPGTRLGSLTLRCHRPLGKVPWKGEAVLESVRLEPVAEESVAAGGLVDAAGWRP